MPHLIYDRNYIEQDILYVANLKLYFENPQVWVLNDTPLPRPVVATFVQNLWAMSNARKFL